MHYAKFERAQPREWRGIPWAYTANSLPTLPEALKWIGLGAAFLAISVLFLGL